MGFDWQTEEDQLWDVAGGSGDVGRRRRWAWLFLLAVLVGLTGWLAWRLATERIASTTEAVEQDVLSSYRLAQQAIEDRDEELFGALLSGRDPAWAAAQEQLFAADLLFTRAARPLGLEVGTREAQVDNVTFDPDLRQAVLTVRQVYSTTYPGGTSEIVTLRHPLVFRQGAQRWLLSPPEEAFWGPWQTLAGDKVTVVFPERERALAQRLLPFLEARLGDYCGLFERRCTDVPAVRVRLETDLDSVLGLTQKQAKFKSGADLILPAPTLVGLPDGEAGAQAIFRGYVAHVLAATSAEMLRYRCCSGRLFFEAMVDRTLNELSLPRQTPAPADYVRVANGAATLQRLNNLWWDVDGAADEGQRLQVYAFTSFLLQTSGADSRDLLLALLEYGSFWGWLQQYAGYDSVAERDALEAAWRDYVLAQANEAASGRSPPLPSQELALICQDQTGQRGLYRYDPSGDRWSFKREVDGRFPALVPTPDDAGVIIFNRIPNDVGRMRPQLRWNGRQIALDEDLVPAYSLPMDPGGRYLTMRRITGPGIPPVGAVLVDLQQCSETSRCSTHVLPGVPYWSPDGSRFLIRALPSGNLLLAERETLSWTATTMEGVGQPFWLDANRYGFVTGDGQRLMVVDLGDAPSATPHMLLSIETVLAALDRESDGRNWKFTSIYGLASGQESLLGAVTLPGSEARHFFLARLRAGDVDIQPLLYVPQAIEVAPDTMLSPGGGTLAMHLFPGPMLDVRFILYDLQRNEAMLDVSGPFFNAFRAHDWSRDGAWLARIGQQLVELMAPGADGGEALYRRFESSGLRQCSSLAWVDPYKPTGH